MTARAQKVLEQALELPPRTRGDLAATLIQSLDEAEDKNASRAWDAEIDRRIDDLDAGRVKSVSWRAVERGLLKTRRAAKRG